MTHPAAMTILEPILDGDAAVAAGEAIADIARALAALPPLRLGASLTDELTWAQAPSLASGRAGIAVAAAYLAAARGEEGGAAAMRFLGEAIEALAETSLGPSLFDGFTGVAWATDLVRDRFFDGAGEDPNGAVDEAIVEHLARRDAKGEVDLMYGVVGMGVYGLGRLARPGGRACVEGAVAALAEVARERRHGAPFWTAAERLPPELRGSFPDGHANLGLAHGLPGIIAFLGHAAARGVAGDQATALLHELVPWLLSQRLGPDSISCFPECVAPGVARPARLAWCYGDLGIAIALLAAARGAGRRDWAALARVIALAAAARSPSESGVVDAQLCHGAAGLGHLFHRLHRATSEPELRLASRRWFEWALASRRPGEGCAGFSTIVHPEAAATPRPVAIPGLLLGAAGIGLALASALSVDEPAWDRCLLVDVG